MSLFEHWDHPELREVWTEKAREAAVRARAAARNEFERMRPGDSADLGHGHIVKREDSGPYAGTFSHYHAGNHEAEGFDIPAMMGHLDRYETEGGSGGSPDWKSGVPAWKFKTTSWIPK